MKIEDDIFKKYSVDIKKLLEYGFTHKKDKYYIEKTFLNNQFRAVIEADKDGKVFGTVYDIENDDEFLPLRVENSNGSFVGEVRTGYEAILLDIRDKCFVKKYFIYSQSNRITNLIAEKYGNAPEFLWEQFDGSGIFRNPETNKWYAAILDVQRNKVQTNSKSSEIIEVIDLKLDPEYLKELVKQPNFYTGYHMNKKYWITVILDDSVSDDTIMDLIAKSHVFTEKRKKK